jgi:tripartite-type tricarboxylate transporter receptor subunit TctC
VPLLLLRRSVCALALALICAPVHAQAQTWPSKPVRVIVPASAGSAVDIVARIVSEELQKQLSQSFVVENRGGGAGTIAQDAVAHAEPDGYTILISTSAHAYTPAIRKNLNFDVERDFAAVTPIMSTPLALIVNPSKFKTIQELVAAGKAQSEKLNFATVGHGGFTHLGAVRFQLSAGFKATPIPYKGSAEAVTEVLAERVDFFFGPILPALSLLKDGRIRALAVSNTARTAVLPDIPTTVEAGYPDTDFNVWIGMFVPSKTPQGIIDRLYLATRAVIRAPGMQQRLADLGGDPLSMSPSEFDAYVRHEIAVGAKLVKAAGIQPE